VFDLFPVVVVFLLLIIFVIVGVAFLTLLEHKVSPQGSRRLRLPDFKVVGT